MFHIFTWPVYGLRLGMFLLGFREVKNIKLGAYIMRKAYDISCG